jgi:inosine-uridine nucleoside N-ribohydrolase
MKHLLIVLMTLMTLALQGQPKIIFDTDFGGDADDLGALVMLHHLMNKEECDLLAVMCWNTEPSAVSAIDAVNRFYGNPKVAIGTRKDDGGTLDWQHSKPIADNFPFELNKEQAPETTVLYRQLLTDSEDLSITIVTVGPLSNIKRLLESQSDTISDLAGKELVKQKVKEFVIMGGQFPEGKSEWNFNGNMPGVTQYVVQHIDVPITFTGYEVGLNIKSGEVFNTIDQNTPLYQGFYHFSKFCPWLNHQFEGKIYDNSTYDQTAVLYAVRGGVGDYWERVSGGRCLPDSVGGNVWISGEVTKHSYLKLLKSNEEMATIIEGLMIDEFE